MPPIGRVHGRACDLLCLPVKLQLKVSFNFTILSHDRRHRDPMRLKSSDTANE